MFSGYFQQGGIMMWFLLACSVAFTAILVERFWRIGLCGKIFRRRINYAEIVRNKQIFTFFKDVPPSIGLLGTVLGVIQSFGLEGGRITAQAAGSGLAVACYTTVFGLAIAILAAVCEYFIGWMMPSDLAARETLT
ncbi:MAG: MotA/TolQ/ExbB proton channel family protein [Planctomycetes bacterium]|nr:MotA/TolQ/ExbB proton channel family protein [Planctomycetota bacterium]